ncbi:MAG: sulfur oxidation c-type cytochrome SoxX [Pseudomonadota bacterium]
MNLFESLKVKLSSLKISKNSVFLSTIIVFLLSFSTSVMSAGLGHQASAIERGQEVAFTRRLGNCLACHVIPGGVSGGNIAPPLMAMKARFPNKEKLRDQIWDPRVNNPDTSMLPFGAHAILTELQIDDLVEYLYTL